MYPMPEPPAEDESVSLEPQREAKDVAAEVHEWLSRLGAIAVAAQVINQLWNDDEVRLYTLHTATRFLQNTALWFGKWAIRCENQYYKAVDSIPH